MAIRLVKIAAYLVGILLLLVLAAGIVIRTSWFQDLVRAQVEQAADSLLSGQLRIGRLHGSLLRGVQLDDVRLQAGGRDVVVVPSIALHYSLMRLVRRSIVIDRITLIRPAITLIESDSGWNVTSLVKTRETGSSSPTSVAVDALEIEDGEVVIEQKQQQTNSGLRIPDELKHLEATLSLAYDAGALRMTFEEVSFLSGEPSPSLVVRDLSGVFSQADGGYRVNDLHVQTDRSEMRLTGEYVQSTAPATVTAHVEGTPLTLAEWSGIVPALASSGITPTFTLDARGPVNALELKGSAADQRAGKIGLNVVLDLDSPRQGVKGSIDVRHFDLQPVTGDPALRSRLNASARVDVSAPADRISIQSMSGSFSLTADDVVFAEYRAEHVDASGRLDRGRAAADIRAEAYGASTKGQAVVAVDKSHTTYQARGRVERLNLSRLPAQLSVPALESALAFAYDVAGVDQSARGTLRFEQGMLESAGIESGAVARFSVGGPRPRYSFEGSLSHVDPERIGRALQVQGLAEPRFEGDLNGTFTIEGRGARVPELDLHATGRLSPSAMFGAELPSLSFDATLAGERLTLTAQGQVNDLEIDRLAINERATGRLDADFDLAGSLVSVSAPITPDSFEGRLTASIRDANPFGVAIRRADVAVSYDDRLARVEALQISGDSLDIKASGPLSMGDHQSDFTYTAQLSRLEDLSELVGHSISGMAEIEGRITGSRERLTASGPVSLTEFRYEDAINALSTKGEYTIAVPNLDARQASVDATVDSTILTVQGRNLTSAQAAVRYQEPALTFDATLRAGARTAVAQGRAVIRPDAQEVRIEHVALGNNQIVWSNENNDTVKLDYSGGIVKVDHMRLSSGSQHLTLDGTLPISGYDPGALTIEAADVDLSGLTDLLLLTRKLKGRLTAAARVEGPAAARSISGNVDVQNGAIDQLTYQSLVGKADYANQVAKVEATLTEKPGAELSVTGTVPVADEKSEIPGDETLALRIKSSTVGLQVIQALTDQVSDLAGTLELNLEVGGTLKTPRVYGELAVRDGTLRVVETGVRYQKLNTQLVFEGPIARVDHLNVQDSDGHTLTASVRVGIEGRSVNTFDMQASLDDFKVLDNRLGSVKIEGNLTLQGGLDSPQIEGKLGISSGTLEVDRILERLTSNPYQTKPTRVDDAEEKTASPGPLTNARFQLTLDVPGNLVLRGTDIKSGDGPALGDMNVTVGGTLELQKEKGDQAKLIGSVTTVRGIYNFQGRRFSVRRDGRIEFHGGEPVDPSLNLAADREVSGVVAHVEIGGTSRKPTLRLSSDPPMEETDILSLIVFNQPANQLGEGERVNLSERAAALAGGVVVGAITESLGRALNLSIFEVETVAEAGGAPMLTVGKQVGSRLFVRLRQIFGAQEVSELQLEYQLTDYLRAQGSVSDGRGLANRSFMRRIERGGLDLVVFVRY